MSFAPPSAGGLALRLLTLGLLAATAPAAGGPSVSDDALADMGRRIYQQGLLPDGSPLRAVRPEGFALEGEQAACATCHRESGMGSVEGSIDRTILVPPVAGPVLFAPARFYGTFLDRSHHWVPNDAWARALTRGAYDEPSLGRSLRQGLDPDGQRLVAPMPRYDLDDRTLSALTAYLRRLGAEPAPGVEANTLHLATVVTPDAPPGYADAVRGVLRGWSAASKTSGSDWHLHIWELSGPAEDWPTQLDARYREQPVFALLSGAGGSEWTPVHRFCERNRIPCILPVVDVAPEGAPGFYSVYFSPGVPLEARILAHHLSTEATPGDGTAPAIVQVFSDTAGHRAAEALAATLEPDRGTPSLRRFRPTAPSAALDAVDEGTVLVLWLRSPDIEQLAAAMPMGPGTGTVYLSSLLAPPESVVLPPAWKDRVTYASLFDDLGLQGEIAKLRLKNWLDHHGLPAGQDLRIQADAYAACYLLSRAIGEIRGQEFRRPKVPLDREHVLETIETGVNKYADGTDLIDPDSHVAYYGRMSLGPRQRTAVRGGMLLRYASPDSQKTVAASGRIVP
jgi:hypothetical protein